MKVSEKRLNYKMKVKFKEKMGNVPFFGPSRGGVGAYTAP